MIEFLQTNQALISGLCIIFIFFALRYLWRNGYTNADLTIEGSRISNLAKKEYEKFLSNMCINDSIQKYGYDKVYTQKQTIRVPMQRKLNEEVSKLRLVYSIDSNRLKNFMSIEQSNETITDELKIKRKVVKQYLKDFISFVSDIPNQHFSKLTNDAVTNGITPTQFFELRRKYDGDAVGVYVIYNQTKDIYYVGQATRLFFRVNQHFTGHGNGDVYADYKYGDQFFINLIKLSESGYDDLDKLEKDKIAEYHAYEDGYNKTHGNG